MELPFSCTRQTDAETYYGGLYSKRIGQYNEALYSCLCACKVIILVEE